MAFLIGAFLGGYVGVLLFSWPLERFLFRQLPPDGRAAASAISGWLIVSIIAGFGFANGGPFRWDASLYYVPGAVAFWLLHRRRLMRAWQQDADDLGDVFE